MNKCKWAQGDFEEICVNADCPMCADFCPVLTEHGVCRYEDRGKRTNADRIRTMTDEELAMWLARETTEAGRVVTEEKYKWRLDWLKKEVSE